MVCVIAHHEAALWNRRAFQAPRLEVKPIDSKTAFRSKTFGRGRAV